MYQLLAENTGDVIWTLDNDLNYTYLSPAVYDLRGFHPEELIGSNALDALTPESRAAAERQYWKVIADEAAGREVEPRLGEAELMHRDGSSVWAEIEVRSMHDERGNRIGFIGSTRNISARKQMELRLRDSERSLRAMLEATEDAVGLFSKDGTIVGINRNMASLLRRGSEEVKGAVFADFLPNDVAARWMEALHRTVETGSPTSLQEVQNGRIFETSVYPVPDEFGKIGKVAVYARDVTERIQAVQAIKQSESQYRRIVETVNEGIMGLDANQQVTFVNQRTADFLGYSVAEMLGRRMEDFMPAREKASQEECFRRRQRGMQDRYERRFLRKDGEIVWGLVSAAPIKGEEGAFLGVFAMIANITESKQAEERLRESEARYRNIFENSVEGLYQSLPEGTFFSVNPALARILGYESPEEVIESISDIATQFYVNPEDRVSLLNILHEQGAAFDFESLVKRKDGGTVWITVNARVVRDKKGRPFMYEGSVVDITERKRTEEALRLTQFSVDIAPLNIYWINREGRLVYANEIACESLGYTGEEMLELHISDIDTTIARETWDEYWNERSQYDIRRFEAKHRRKDGSSFPVGVTSHYKEYGGKEYMFVYSYDLTERVRAGEALRRSRELLNEVQRISLTGGWEIDLIAQEVHWTDGQFHLHGMEPQEGSLNLRTLIKRCVHPEDRSQLFKNLKKVLREKVPTKFEYRPLLPGGEEAILVGTAIPDVDENGEVWRVFGSSRDVTMERRAARNLQLSHERLLTILDGIDADIYVSDMNSHAILFMNAHMRESFGSPPPGASCHEFFRGESEQCSFCPKPELLDEKGDPVETLVSEWFDSFSSRWFLNQDRVIRWLEGEMVHMHVAADITDLKVMAEDLRVAMGEAEAANLAKNEFLANMSHEIRTPLNGLLGMLQLLQFTDLVEEQRDYLETAVSSGRNLMQILNDILDLSKVESGKLELEAQVFELGEVLDSVISVFRYQAESRGLDISWKIDETLPRHFVADKGRLRQILFNLVGNASKFTDSGQIKVEAYPLPLSLPDGRVRLFFSVSDTGIGIPDDKVGSVFDPFTQVDGSFTRKYQGTGLGLGIVRRLASLMGGNVAVMSEEGKGTTVTFTLLVDGAEEVLNGSAAVNANAESFRLSILLAEDERVNQIVAKHLLGKLGHEVVCVENGLKAVEVLRKVRFDCILMDIQMPGLDGMETTRVIRDTLHLDLPIIALTAHAMKGDKERFLEAGMNGYVSKPFDLLKLEAELQRVMGAGG